MSAPWVRWDADDLILTLRVQPRASRDTLQPDAARLRVRITAPPVDGAANAYLQRYLADCFGVAASRVALVRGESSREKVVRIASPRSLPPSLSEHVQRN